MKLERLRNILVISVLVAGSTTSLNAQTKILFDNTKAETAGNADWVIDADTYNLGWNPNAIVSSSWHGSNAQQIPTPAQSGINASTPETYWTGGLSYWGIDCVNKGYVVQTLPYNGQITYGNTSNPQDLSLYKVYIVCEPNIRFTAAEKTALMQFVQNGGGLFMISDHDQSDRNGDGYDSPTIWNDFMNNNSVHNAPFGISFDLLNFSGTSTNIVAPSTDSIINGSAGVVTQVKWSNGTSMTLNPTQNASVKGVIYKSGTTGGGNSNVLVAYANYGNGKVAAIGDSSPCDDGTGNPNTTLYNGYTQDAAGNHRKLLMNITIWLATTTAPTSIPSLYQNDAKITLSPNPSSGIINLATDQNLEKVKVLVYSGEGTLVYQQDVARLEKGTSFPLTLSKGYYFVKITGDQINTTQKIIVY